MKSLRIVFMGTAEFAVATLGSLLMNGYNVVCAVTAPDKPAGRGRKVSKSPVKEFAESSRLPVLQPENLKDQGFIDSLTLLNPDLFIVVAFRMLPMAVWKIPPMGTINLHASLLPDYRGAAPINHAIINGETVTGLTTFLIDEKIDTGNILLREEIQISPSENAGELHDRLMKFGARLVIKTIAGLSDKTLKPRQQSEFMSPGMKPKDAPKLFPETCIFDWNKEPVQLFNFIRGLSPYPGARFSISNNEKKITLKVFDGSCENAVHNLAPGTLISDGKSYIKIACRNGFLYILSLQPEGKKRMTAAEFLRGFNINGWALAN
jgi:methionyl-tRNA formyltransferase